MKIMNEMCVCFCISELCGNWFCFFNFLSKVYMMGLLVVVILTPLDFLCARERNTRVSGATHVACMVVYLTQIAF